MNVSKEEIIHIAKLANLDLKEEEIDNYILNLQDILNFANIVNNAKVDNLEQTIGINENENVFRKDEVKKYENPEELLKNGKNIEQNMYKIPKVI